MCVDTQAMRFLVGPLAVAIVFGGWDLYYHGGRYTHQIAQAASAIVHRAF
jgi:hypothetical protein